MYYIAKDYHLKHSNSRVPLLDIPRSFAFRFQSQTSYLFESEDNFIEFISEITSLKENSADSLFTEKSFTM